MGTMIKNLIQFKMTSSINLDFIKNCLHKKFPWGNIFVKFMEVI